MKSRRKVLNLGLKTALLTGICVPGPSAFAKSWLDMLNDMVGGKSASTLPAAEIVAGLKEARQVGSRRVIQRVGTRDGFQLDPQIHIPLPGKLAKVQSALRHIGLSGMADDLELRLNRGAEKAAGEAKQLFWKAVNQMTVRDAVNILEGPKDSATRYFQRTMTPELKQRFKPIVHRNLADVGALRSFEQMMKQYRTLPFVPDIRTKLSEYAVEKTLAGIFYYLAREEADIRTNPVKRTTALLKKVFGSQQ